MGRSNGQQLSSVACPSHVVNNFQTTGLAAIHNAGIIHRDLKPENVFIDFRFNARIGDFGCAYIEPQGKSIYSFGNYCHEVCGTWPYTAPEMADNTGKHVDYRRAYSLGVDYWALGCIVFELERDGAGVRVPTSILRYFSSQSYFISIQALFETLTDLTAYRNYQPLRHRGKSYFAFAKLSLNAESLISGVCSLSDLRCSLTNFQLYTSFCDRDQPIGIATVRFAAINTSRNLMGIVPCTFLKNLPLTVARCRSSEFDNILERGRGQSHLHLSCSRY